MAKGGSRKNGATITNHERLIGSAAIEFENGTDNDLPDLVEEDVWSTMADNTTDDDGRDDWFRNSGDQTRPWHDGVSNRLVGGLSLAFEDAGRSSARVIHHQFLISDNRRCHMAASAPVSVPDWPKILLVDSSDSLRASMDGSSEWMPPHEYLARENAASGKMVPTSVFEGVGRTLKGRDMSRVRNAVWRQTGFFG